MFYNTVFFILKLAVFSEIISAVMSSIFHFQMQQKEPRAKLYLFLVFALPYLRVR